MAHISGIKLHRTPTGKIKSVTFDMKKHGDLLQPILKQVGAVEEDDFEKRWREGYTVEEVFNGLMEKIDGMKWDK